MSNVVQFGAKPPEDDEPKVWTCAHCGCQNFFLYSNGDTECSLCHHIGSDATGGWLENLNQDPEFNEDIVPRLNTPHGTADFAKAAVMKGVDADTVAIAVIWPSGRIRFWSIFDETDSPERQAWLRQALQTSADLAFGVKSDPGDLPE